MLNRHLKNLAKLADYLEEEVTDKQFNIGYFLRNYDEFKDVMDIVSECGTVGCAVGWASALFYKQAKLAYSWLDFSRQMFGCCLADDEGVYMFDSNWRFSKHGRTRTATIKRIRQVVEQKGELTKYQRSKVYDINRLC